MTKVMELNLALSPYSLASREACAMAALVLGTRIVTMMPEPASGTSREDIGAAVERAPRFLRLMDSFRWSTPLWRAGVISAAVGGEHAFAEFQLGQADGQTHGADRRGGANANGAGVLTRPKPAGSEPAENDQLDLISADILRGGPDPSINIPVTSALDRFASRHGYTVVRPAPAPTAEAAHSRVSAGSMVQRAEMRLGEKRFALALPMLIRAGGGRILELRKRLEPRLRALRHELASVIVRARTSGANAAASVSPASIKLAAHEYAEAFEEMLGDTLGDDELGERIVAGSVSLSGIELPVDSAVRAAAIAARGARGRGGLGRHAPSSGTSPKSAHPGRMFALAIREMSARPVASR